MHFASDNIPWIDITPQSLHHIAENSREAAVLRSTLHTLRVDPRDTFVVKDDQIEYLVTHQEDGGETIFQAALPFLPQTKQFKALLIKEYKENGREIVKLDVAPPAPRKRSPSPQLQAWLDQALKKQKQAQELPVVQQLQERKDKLTLPNQAAFNALVLHLPDLPGWDQKSQAEQFRIANDGMRLLEKLDSTPDATGEPTEAVRWLTSLIATALGVSEDAMENMLHLSPEDKEKVHQALVAGLTRLNAPCLALPAIQAMTGVDCFVVPDTLKLDPAIRTALTQLQQELNADPSKTQQEKAAGPTFQNLLEKIKGQALADLARNTVRKYRTSLTRLDAYRLSLPQPVTVGEMLATLPAFTRHLQAAARTHLSPDDIRNLRGLYGVWYPDTPARRKMQELVDTEDAFANIRQSQAIRNRYLHIGTDIDIYLAEQQCHFADVCPRDGADDAENDARRSSFIEMKDALITNAPNDNALKHALGVLRTSVHKLPQDDDLRTLIDRATYKNGDAVGATMKNSWKALIPHLAEVLARHRVDVRVFVNAIRTFDMPGRTAKENLAAFQQEQKPFPNSNLNYAAIKDKLGTVISFNEMLHHILANRNMAQIPL